MSVNFSGIWTADLSESRFLGAAPTALTIRIDHSDPELEEEIVTLKSDGHEQSMVLQCRTDGQDGKSSVDGKAVRGGARWEGDELVIELWVNVDTRELHLCDHWSLSPDGQTLYMEHRNDDLAGQRAVLRRKA